MLAAAHRVGPKATALFHRGRLFSLGMTGIVSAFDAATGRLAWQTPAAFDAKTGAVKWSAPGRAAYASPIIVELGGVRHVVTMTENSVFGVSMSNGTRLWEHAWPSRGTPSAITPIQLGEALIVSSQGIDVAALAEAGPAARRHGSPPARRGHPRTAAGGGTSPHPTFGGRPAVARPDRRHVSVVSSASSIAHQHALALA